MAGATGRLEPDGELYAYFGLSGPAPLLAADHPVVVISLNKRSYVPGETIEGLIIPDTPTDIFSGGGYILSRMDERLRRMVPIRPIQEIVYRGGAPIGSLPIRITAPATVGAYRVEFVGGSGSHRTIDRTAGWFAVTSGHVAQGPTPPSPR